MKAKSIDWVSVHYEPSELMTPNKRDVTVSFRVSPLDIPEMWRYGIRTNSIGKRELVVEFKYLTAAESKRSFFDGDVKIEVGKNSKRIYTIVLPIQDSSRDSEDGKFNLVIEMAIDKIQTWEDDNVLRSAHADVIQEMLKQQKARDMGEAIAF